MARHAKQFYAPWLFGDVSWFTVGARSAQARAANDTGYQGRLGSPHCAGLDF